MASATELRKGKVINYEGSPYIILDLLHRTPGRRSGFVQATMRNLLTGSSLVTKFLSSDSVEFCHTDALPLEFSYHDAQGYHFLNPDTFEDFILPNDVVEDQKEFLIPNKSYQILFIDEKPVQIQLPAAVEMKVTDAPDAIRGDSASNVQKSVTTETGLVVQVPLFIKTGEIIRVKTDDKAYLGRA